MSCGNQVDRKSDARDKESLKESIKEDVWLELTHPRHIRRNLDLDSMAKEIGVGPAYLREVLARRRNGSVPLLDSIARCMGKNEAARKKIYRLLLGVASPK